MRRLISLLAYCAIGSAAGQARGQSALDGFDPNANGKVYVVIVQPDGKIVLGGEFTTLSPNGGATVAIVRNLEPGSYTAIVRGVNSATGVALVEAYGLN